ncbi:MAG: ATP-binding protein [Azonexus sp.]
MNSHSTEISVCARYGEIPGLMAEFARRAAALGVAEADIQRLQLVLEELFTNSIRHGYGAESDALIRVDLKREDNGPRLYFCDRAPLFDITAYTPATAPEIGGLGIPLIRGMSKAIRYTRRDSCNITELDF